jgi:hypothetical protein
LYGGIHFRFDQEGGRLGRFVYQNKLAPARSYAFAAIPARFAHERRHWPDAAALRVTSAFPWSRFPYAEAITHFARALSAARIGDRSVARAEIVKLASIRQSLTPVEGSYDWGTQVEIQHRSAVAWLAHAEGTMGRPYAR